MKNLLTSLFLLLSVTILSAQFYNNGSVIYISNGSTLYSTITISNTNSGEITNEGLLSSASSIINFSGSQYSGNGTYCVGQDFINTATFLVGTSTIQFKGNAAGTIFSGNAPLYNLSNQKTTGNITLVDDVRITNALTFSSTSSKIVLEANDLTLDSSAPINGADEDNYIVTNAGGKLIKNQLAGNFVFPVGNNTTTYNPITVNQSGTPDNISVRVLGEVYEDGLSGAAITNDVVAATWEVEEAIAGGSNLALTPQWEASDEEGNFDRNNSSLHTYNGSWLPGNFGPATGVGPYTQIRAGITEGGLFAVGGPGLEGGVLLDLYIMLQGPYLNNITMADNLRALPSFPKTEPYTALGFTHHFRGGGETITQSTLDNNAIVDWVIIELRDSNTPSTVVASRAALLLTNGKIVDLDGVSDLQFDGVASGDYYVAVDHRNHLGVMTANTMALSRSASFLDFSTGGVLYGGTNNQVQMDLGVGVFGLYGGDHDINGVIDAADRSSAWNNRNAGGYLTVDSTLDGICDAEERSQTWNNRNKSSYIP